MINYNKPYRSLRIFYPRYLGWFGLPVVLGMFLLLISCGKEEIPLPLSEDQLTAILIDMHIAESMIEKLPVSDRDTVGNVYYRMIYREHKVSKEDFDASMSVLREDPERLNEIYSRILEELNVLEATSRGVEEME